MAVAAPLDHANRQAPPEAAQQNNATFLTFSVQQEGDAQAYYEEFYRWNARNCCRSTWKCLMDFVIVPILSAAAFVLGCTVLLPYCIYLAVTRQQQLVSMQQSEIVREFMEEEPAHSREVYQWQVRIRAQQIDENAKGTFRHCIDIACPLLWPLTGICLLVDKVNAWLHGRIRPEEVYLHQQTFPSTRHERDFFHQREMARSNRVQSLLDSSRDAMLPTAREL